MRGAPLPAAVPLVGVLLLTVPLAAGCAVGAAPAPAAVGAAFHGDEPPGELPERPSFVLTDTEGERFDFAEQTGGRPDAALLRLHELPRRVPDGDGRHRRCAAEC
jgi:hypothetical protein